MTKGRQSLIRPLEARDQERGWTVRIDQEFRPEVTIIEISSPNYGRLAYGMTAGGYDGWSFAEPAGGGSVIVPFVVRDGVLLIGVVSEVRHNLGGRVLNVPRGFLDPGESHLQTARRELLEETGLANDSLFELPGKPVNWNSAFCETPEEDLGVRFFGLELDPILLTDRNGILRLTAAAFSRKRQSSQSRLAEKIGALRFIDWRDACRLRDMFTIAAVARLLDWLDEKSLSAAKDS